VCVCESNPMWVLHVVMVVYQSVSLYWNFLSTETCWCILLSEPLILDTN